MLWVVILVKKSSILWVKFKKVGSILWVMLKRRVQFLWDVFFFQKNWIRLKKGFNYLTHFPKVNSFKSNQKYNSSSRILIRVQFFPFFLKKKKVQFCDSNSKKKGSILWVKFKNSQFCESFFEKSSFLGVIFEQKVRFFSSYLNKRSNSLRHIKEIRVQFFGHIERKKVQFCESYWKNSSLRVKQKKVQFFES